MKTSAFSRIVLLALTGLSVVIPARLSADEITDELAAANEAYGKGDISGALQALDMARQLLLQKTAGDLAKLFPEFKGLKRGEPESSAAGQAMFGGMVTAECQYTAESGDGTMTVKYITKSPMLQSVLMLYNMPGLGGGSGMKVERIAGKRALVQANKVQIVHESEMLVEIDYQDVSWDTVKAFIAALPWDKLTEQL